MDITSLYRFLIGLICLNFLLSCTSDKMSLEVGDDIMSDDHKAFYTEDFDIRTKTKLAEYEVTNNTGIAFIGAVADPYIGNITANTVFKVSPNINKKNLDNFGFVRNAVLDSMTLVLRPNGYVYGDSTSRVTLSVHRITENYQLDTVRNLEEETVKSSLNKKNNSVTMYDASALATFSFTPEDMSGDSILVRLPNALGQEWFDKIIKEDDNFVINTSQSEKDSDEKFIKNVLNGLTIRNHGSNNAIVGFDMPKSGEENPMSGITIRMHYHTTGPYVKRVHDFIVYAPEYQYNQIGADFSTGLLKGITPGGEGIPSSKTNNLSFIQSGLGLMTEVEVPSFFELYFLGKNVTIIDADLIFAAKPRSFVNNYRLPTNLSPDLLMRNGYINSDGLLSINGAAVDILNTKLTRYDAEYALPITRYVMDEQELLSPSSTKHQTLLLSARNKDSKRIPNLNRLVLGNGENNDCAMKVKMYYTNFE